MERNYNKIVIESSPFIRTKMTASIIAKILELDHFKLNYRISEWMHPDFYTDNPIPKLELKNKTVEEIK
jgi:broad specificity phosphatase PhoE